MQETTASDAQAESLLEQRHQMESPEFERVWQELAVENSDRIKEKMNA